MQLEKGVAINIDGRMHRTKKASAQKLKPAQTDTINERHPPIRVRKNIPDSWLSLTLTEGKNRQVRRMTAAVGFPTLRLIRYAIGGVTLDGIDTGAFKSLGEAEKRLLFVK